MAHAVSAQEPDTTARQSLGFEVAVRAELDGLVSKYGLTLIGSDAHSAHYASECIWLVIRHGRLSYELSLDMARPGHDEEQEHPYSLQDAMRVTAREAARDYRDFAATSAGAVSRGLRLLARDIRTYCEPALRCDPEFFAAMARERSVAVEEFARQPQRGSEDASAREAMERRDWDRVIAIYESRRDALSRSEEKRLEIARRHAACDST